MESRPCSRSRQEDLSIDPEVVHLEGYYPIRGDPEDGSKRDNPELASPGVAADIFARHLDKHPQRVLPGDGVKRLSGSAADA